MAKKSRITAKPDLLALAVQGLLLCYILFDIRLSPKVAGFGRTPIGMAVVAILALSAFAAIGPVAGVLSLLAAYVFFDKAHKGRGSSVPNLDRMAMDRHLSAAGEGIPETLEEKVVSQMAPSIRGTPMKAASFVPVLAKRGGVGAKLQY
jgi:hypothetical protein